MTSFYNIPDELLYQMCESWDTNTLLNMSQAYDRVYQRCSTIINERKYKGVIEKIISYTTDLQFGTPVLTSSGNYMLIIHVIGDRIYNIYKGMASMIYLPRLRLIGPEKDLKGYLKSKGLTDEQISLELSQRDNLWHELKGIRKSLSWDERYLK